MYEYKAIAQRVVDGDTIDFYIDVGFRMTTVQRVRLLGCNCPEMNRRESREDAILARNAVMLWMTNNPEVRIRTEKSDDFGRWLADVYREDDPISLSMFLIHNGYAESYRDGGK